jgi:putative GTP pyrophosphokinase
MQNLFDVISVDNKIDDGDPKLFGYFSVHLVARLKSSYSGRRYDQIKDLVFEIQIRTIAMDAWASASHYLSYKSDADVPEDLRRDFHALSGLFYVADKYFELFFRARAKNLEKIRLELANSSQSSKNRNLDLDTLTTFLKQRFSDRAQPDGQEAAELLAEIRKVPISDLANLDEVLDLRKQMFLDYEKEFPPSAKTDRKWEPGEVPQFTASGVVRVSLRQSWNDEKWIQSQRTKKVKSSKKS